jgi:hypothetical protein
VLMSRRDRADDRRMTGSRDAALRRGAFATWTRPCGPHGPLVGFRASHGESHSEPLGGRGSNRDRLSRFRNCGFSLVDLAGRCVNHLPLLLELRNQSTT